MDTTVTELRLYHPRIGFFTEVVNADGQPAINLVKARTGPDTQVLTLTTRTVPSLAERRECGGTTGWRR
jgi:hypothetical protein